MPQLFFNRVNDYVKVLVSVVKELKQTTPTAATRKDQTKGLMSKTIAVHVRYKSLYISLPSSQNSNVK